MKHITKGKFDNLKIPLPSLPRQKKIAEVLDKADELRQIKKKTIEKLDQLIQSIFLEMFGEPVNNPKGWDIKKLGDVCSKITDGTNVTPTYLSEGVGVKHLHLIDIRSMSIICPTIATQEEYKEKIEKILQIRKDYENSAHKIDNLFNSLMQRAFNGELKFKD